MCFLKIDSVSSNIAKIIEVIYSTPPPRVYLKSN